MYIRFIRGDEYGNNSDIEFSLDLKPLIQFEKFADNFVAPIQNFCEARFVTILNKFKELTNPSKGLEIGLLSTGLIYRFYLKMARIMFLQRTCLRESTGNYKITTL